ncbi:unnamed protein product [Pleuronectes platessa]|uniref:Uncharacterized protein n=1 Tax=Pleuronectes platessa TaxID=8262 RepID=A0A9N7TLU8_PLEPL|nr:unnamed protein product [Pleuronectes platessa]
MSPEKPNPPPSPEPFTGAVSDKAEEEEEEEVIGVWLPSCSVFPSKLPKPDLTSDCAAGTDPHRNLKVPGKCRALPLQDSLRSSGNKEITPPPPPPPPPPPLEQWSESSSFNGRTLGVIHSFLRY